MKQIISLTVAGIIGGLVVITGLKFTESPTIIESNAPAQVVKASNIINPGVNTDFVHASAVATDAVVHINAQESRTLAMQRQEESRRNRRGSAFDNFFGGGDFFVNGTNRDWGGAAGLGTHIGTGDFDIYSGVPGGGAWFVGSIEEARIYNGVLTGEQIKQL